ncbi:MAG: hypothetical protein AMXMBFR84_04640 [Candidatus Hydrogenedentota bacterium]
MDSIAPVDFEVMAIAKILEREILRVPRNQREYSWTNDNVDDLFQDIADAIADNSPIYFLGTVVLSTTSDGYLEIVDGQQRIATTTILLTAMRDYLYSIYEKDIADSIDSDFIRKYIRSKREYSPKLTLNVDDNSYYRDNLIALPHQRLQKESLLESHRLLENALKTAEDRVRTIVHGHGDPSKRINDWVDYLANKAVVIVLKAPSAMDAFKMFETLNDRGLPTTQADMLKNYLFAEADSDGADEAQRNWTSMRVSLESLGQDDITLTYLRHFTLMQYGPIEHKRSFYDRLQKRIKGKTKALSFLAELANYADDYAAILTPSHSKWAEYPNAVPSLIGAIRFLGVTQIRPLILAVAHHFNNQEAEKAFKSFISWTVRFLIAGGMRGQTLEDAYAEHAYAVSQGKITTTKELRKSLLDRRIIHSDEVFKEKFADATVSKGHLARYYLRAMEAKVTLETDNPETAPLEDPAILNLEHILPATPGDYWGHIEQELANAFYKRIGNMVLLNAKKNQLLGNCDFKKKRECFSDSGLLLTKRVADATTESTLWGPEEIKKRQAALAKIAVETWPL